MSKTNRQKAVSQYNNEVQAHTQHTSEGADMTQEEYNRNPTRMYMNGHITRKQWERTMRAELELALARLRAER